MDERDSSVRNERMRVFFIFPFFRDFRFLVSFLVSVLGLLDFSARPSKLITGTRVPHV